MTKEKDAYQATITSAQARLTTAERVASKVLRIPVIDLVLRNLERSIFRTIPLQFGLIASITVGMLLYGIAYFYGYKINGMSILFNVFILGFIVGVVYEYVRTMIRQTK